MATPYESPLLPGPTKTRILFGSCNLAQAPQPLWQDILDRKPDLWIWGGDNVYADIFKGVNPVPFPHGEFEPASANHLRHVYAMMLKNPDYVKFLNASVPMLSTWDDHDFGINDGDDRYENREESQAAFLDFIGEPAASPRRQQKGVYTSQLIDYGAATGQLGRKVLVVLLDLRYHKDPYGTPDGDFLGQAQWDWLNRTLGESTADVHLIMSSLQMLQTRHVAGENWVKFPAARERLLRLLARHNVSSPIVLSGDVHFAELGMGHCSGGRLLEVTSSGMTHSIGTHDGSHPNAVIDGAAHQGFELAMRVMPWRYRLADNVTGAPQYTVAQNFGELEFDWPARRLGVRILGHGGVEHLSQDFDLDALGVGRLGEAGVADFGPPGGEPALWRVGLGVAVCASVPLLTFLGCAAAAWKLGRLACRAVRSSTEDSDEEDSKSDAGSDTCTVATEDSTQDLLVTRVR